MVCVLTDGYYKIYLLIKHGKQRFRAQFYNKIYMKNAYFYNIEDSVKWIEEYKLLNS